MLGFVYWHDATRSSHETAFNDATTAGCIVGMAFFGLFADIFGRLKMYRWELVVLTAGTTGVVMSSTGYVSPDRSNGEPAGSIDYGSFGSMNIQSWLLFWRFLSGIGIGGEYLSAVIASEFAPTLKRPRSLAIVFAMQAFGIAAGAIVSLVVTIVVHMRQPDNPARVGVSARAVDQVWRWVIGLALIPALFTAILRFTIPESPRYTLDVLDDPLKASVETDRLKGFCLRSEIIHQSNSVVTQNSTPNDEVDVTSLAITDRHDLCRDPLSLTIRQYFWIEGDWRTLLATSLSWFFLDFATLTRSLNEAPTLSRLWYGPTVVVKDPETWDSNTANPNTNFFAILIKNSVHRLVIDSIPALTGIILLILCITRLNRKMLTWVMFAVTGLLLVFTGIMLLKSTGTHSWGVNILLYALIKFATAFGIGPLTFLLPAELFPTKYRATCHGISAAAGKFGYLLVSIILVCLVGRTKSTPSGASIAWLSYVSMFFTVPLLLAAVVCWMWIPELQDSSGRSFSLEQLAEGRRSARSGTVTDSDSSRRVSCPRSFAMLCV